MTTQRVSKVQNWRIGRSDPESGNARVDDAHHHRAIVGVSSAQKMSTVRWGVAGNIVWAWNFTIPALAFMAAVAWWIGQQIL